MTNSETFGRVLELVDTTLPVERNLMQYQDNRRLETMLIVMESAAKDLDKSTRRFKDANDKLEDGLKRKVP